jgi:hypothetical protein
MKDRITALGLYINEKLGKHINFKQIKGDPIYKGVLFTCMKEDYLISDKKSEVIDVIVTMSNRKAEDYPTKMVKRYTHTKFRKIRERKPVEFKVKGKSYFIIKM